MQPTARAQAITQWNQESLKFNHCSNVRPALTGLLEYDIYNMISTKIHKRMQDGMLTNAYLSWEGIDNNSSYFKLTNNSAVLCFYEFFLL